MTGEQVRDLGYLAWKDPWAWMERMSGNRWKQLLANERKNWRTLTNQEPVKSRVADFKKQIDYATDTLNAEIFSIGCQTIFLSYTKKDSYWRWKWSKRREKFFDIDFQETILWVVRPDKSTSSSLNELVCRSVDDTILWKKKFTSSDIAVKDGLCYYIKVKGLVTTTSLYCCDALSGKNETLLFEEKNKQNYLNIVKTSGRTIYLQSVNSGKSKTWQITGKKLVALDTDTDLQIPCGQIFEGEDCRIIKRIGSNKYELRGKPFQDWIMPRGFPIWIGLDPGFIIMMEDGKEALYKCEARKHPKLIFRLSAGSIIPNPYSNWESAIQQTFHVLSPERDPFLIQAIHNNFTAIPLKSTTFPKLQVHNSHVISMDGTNVPFCWIMKASRTHPRGLLVTAYGAYGQTTVVRWPWQYWGPLIERGWAIAFAYVRGGGERDFNWAEQARRENRHRSVEDMLAVIAASRRATGVPANKTAIYGRSAGGFLVGSTLAKSQDGQLFGAVYTEVPYVDLLRTTTNPALPLTIGEYDEFGNPAEHLLDFIELLKVSPINSLPEEGIRPEILVIARTGLLDYKVYPYEPYKWIQRLRGFLTPDQAHPTDPRGKFIDYEASEGHSYSPTHFSEARAIDLAILDAWVGGELKF
jgi:hypothetical protein